MSVDRSFRTWQLGAVLTAALAGTVPCAAHDQDDTGAPHTQTPIST